MTTNVRFYRLGVLPSFEVDKHKGIFVHVTSKLTRTGKEGNYTYNWGGKPEIEIPEIVIQKIEERTILVPEWMDLRRIDTVESGLWFGGENGWELLSNDTTSGAIDAAIDAKIKDLDVSGYAQATITGSTLKILGIQEVNGKISNDSSKDVNIAIDGTYDESTNKIATQSTVTNAIGALDVNTVQAVTFNTSNVDGNTTLTFKGIKEVDGRIAQGDEQTPNTFIVGDAKLNIEIGADSFEVFSANAKENKSIYLDKNVFKKDVVEGKNVLSVIAKTAVASNNKLVTEQDIASLGGAMHYKGTINDPSAWPTTVKAGDVYISTVNRNFIHNEQQPPIEPGDMIVFNSENVSDFTVVQSNLTLGIKSGQIAKNDGDLSPNNNVVIATSAGIKTISITESDLTSGDKNTRTLTYTNGDADTSDATLFHSTTITDTFKVINKDFNQSINISSTNRSIKIARNAGDNDSTGVMVDLVWNTTMENNN